MSAHPGFGDYMKAKEAPIIIVLSEIYNYFFELDENEIKELRDIKFDKIITLDYETKLSIESSLKNYQINKKLKEIEDLGFNKQEILEYIAGGDYNVTRTPMEDRGGPNDR